MSNVIKSLYVGENEPSQTNPLFLIVLASAIVIPLVNMNECFLMIMISLHQKPLTVRSTSFPSLFIKYSLLITLIFVGLVTVTKFREDDPEQPYIPPRSFYRRFTFEYKARKLQVTPFFPLTIFS